MAEPFTIRIFVPDGDPEGVRLIDRMNWTGLGVVFHRENWADTSKRAEFARAGVYFLAGHPEEDDERSTLYIGQADGLRTRIGQQLKAKDFWHWGVAFVSTNEGLNRAHITWLEYALIKRAQSAESWRLVNGNAPQEPALSESEKADTRAFLQEILQILPLVGLTAFQARRAVARPHGVMRQARPPRPRGAPPARRMKATPWSCRPNAKGLSACSWASGPGSRCASPAPCSIISNLSPPTKPSRCRRSPIGRRSSVSSPMAMAANTNCSFPSRPAK